MSVLVECVPNFSEGRDKAKVEAIVAAARAVAGVSILDVETDSDHNRCVLSFVAPPDAAVEACFRVAQKSRELIDLNAHKGEHPRMGAVDVIPFIPVSGIDIKGCAGLAERLGQRIGAELEIPVYLYDHAARKSERKDLAAVRKGQFEGLKELIGKDPSRMPDFGPNRIHPTAGAVAVGARQQIVNFNLNLDISDMAAGKDIAKRLRASGGGLPCVRGKEIELSARKQVQISTVLTDYKTTSMAKTLAEARRLAAEHGAKVVTTEIVGLLPRQALVDLALDTLNLENFNPEVQILESRLEAVGALRQKTGWQESARVLGDALATTDATPGGGSAAGIAGAMGCGLGLMAVGISLKSKKLDPARKPGLEEARMNFSRLKADFERLTGEDSAAFDHFMAALALPRDNPQRPAKMQGALIHAAEVPLRTAAAAAEAFAIVQGAMPGLLPAVLSDMHSAGHLLKAAALCAAENVRINLEGIKDQVKADELARRLEELIRVFRQAVAS
ncbi:MAG TPA: glutamate formimidoyltransferase [Elusimicrobia bacterium]|nr:glutamate formimidoyltransferase [Elusimicrobiota bacterium]HBT62390.1 glutamate formimidoyltransferase [Elusimicrobiota bacterium]